MKATREASAAFLAVGLAAITFVLYFPTRAYAWVNFDDNDYITGNIHVASGLTRNNIVWAFTHFHAGYWIPVTWISHMVDCQIWGLNPGPPHLVNAAFHSLNAALVFLLFSSITGTFWRSATVAALFAFHPLHVESVAWLAARKDVVSAFFWLCATIAYVQYSRRRSIGSYSASIAFFVLGLMAKPTLVTLPLTLLLLDYWPLNRGCLTSTTSETKAPQKRLRPVQLLTEKIPFFVISAMFSALTFISQHKAGALSSMGQLSVLFRLKNAVLNYEGYLAKSFWPHRLAVFYPLPQTISNLTALSATVALLTITAFTIWQARARPYLAVGWFWFLLTFLPMIGLFQSGGQALADRFAYIPLIGLFIAVVWGLSNLVRIVVLPALPVAAAAIVLGACLVSSMNQMRQWHDPITLFSRALEVSGPTTIALDHLGAEFFARGDTEKAIEQFQSAINLNPAYPDAHNNLAAALFQTGKRDEAFRHFDEALMLDPHYARAYYNYGNALFRSGDIARAAERYWEAIRENPDHLQARNNLGIALRRLGREQEAVQQFKEALKLDANFRPARENLEAPSSGKTQ